MLPHFVLIVLQETLDQIAQIDLVVNLKCSDEHLVNRNALNETALPRQDILSSMLHSAVAIKARRESLGVYAEEVLFWFMINVFVVSSLHGEFLVSTEKSCGDASGEAPGRIL